MKTWGMLLVGLSLGLTGCAGADAGSTETAVPTSEPPETRAPVSEPAQSEIKESICADDPGDSTSTVVDLEEVRLLSDGKLMFLTFITAADVPTTGTVLYSATAWSEDGNTGYQMGAKFQDGQEIANFVYDAAGGGQVNITNGAVAADKQVSMRYPLAELEGLGESFTWSGTATVEGTDVDRCPDGEKKAVFPDA